MIGDTNPPNIVLEPPACDDRPLWDLWVSRFHLPAVAVADELGLFSRLNSTPATATEISKWFSLSSRGAESLLGVLVGLGFLRRLRGMFHLTEQAGEFLVPDRPYYWGGLFAAYRIEPDRASPARLLAALREDDGADKQRATTWWQQGSLTRQNADVVTAYMHAHSFPSAVGFARRADFTGIRRLLDVGGGSGCFSLAVAMRYPDVSCTVMDLPEVCAIAQGYAERYEMAQRIETFPTNFFQDPWPQNYDAALFSNILHDWGPGECEELLNSAHGAVAPGGKIFIHEALLGDGRDDNLTSTSYSLQMTLGTLGKQFSLDELVELLDRAGFVNPRAKHSFSHFWTVTADRP